MYYSFIGKGIDGSLFKIQDDIGRVFVFKASHQKRQIEYEEKIHFHIYNMINCKKYIVKPLKLDNNIKAQITKSIGFKHGYAMEYIEGVTLLKAFQMMRTFPTI